MSKVISENKVIFLPRTEKEFDALIKTLVKRYKLPSPEHAAAIVANRIQHLPPDQATTTLKHLGHCILKNIAYQVAQSRSRILTHRAEVDDILAHLKSTPNDQQAIDALTKAAGNGSEYAKAALETLGLPSPSNVLELIKSNPGEDTASAAVSPGPA